MPVHEVFSSVHQPKDLSPRMSPSRVLQFTILVLMCFHAIPSARILLVPIQRRSNIREMALLSEDLVLNGHLVFIVVGSTFQDAEELHDQDLQVLSFHVAKYDPMLYSSEVENEITDSVFRHKTPDYIGATVSEFAFHGCEVMMRDQPLLDQLRMIHFDLAIIDAFPLAPCASIVPHHLGIPFITKDASPLAVHQPLFPAFIPHSNLHLSHKMYFWERVENAIVLLMELYGLASPSINDLTLLKKFSPCLVDWNELLRLALLHISTTDHHLSYPTPVLANHVQLPGVTWRNTRPLNNPIFRFMDLAPEGAVVVSFGSSVHSLPPRYLKTLFSAFQNFSGLVFYLKLDQQIIHSVDVPRNVLPLSWLPLNDLLGHPRTKLFISHCGRSVLHESVFHGVPVMCIPLFKEDEINTQNVVYLGLGKHVDIFTASAKTLKDTTSELLRNEMYQKNVKRISLMLKSHKFNPTETVAFWVEHVLKFGGSHLRSEAMNMTSAQFAMLDIALAFFVLFSCLFWFAYAYMQFLVHIINKPKDKKKRCNRC